MSDRQDAITVARTLEQDILNDLSETLKKSPGKYDVAHIVMALLFSVYTVMRKELEWAKPDITEEEKQESFKRQTALAKALYPSTIQLAKSMKLTYYEILMGVVDTANYFVFNLFDYFERKKQEETSSGDGR